MIFIANINKKADIKPAQNQDHRRTLRCAASGDLSVVIFSTITVSVIRAVSFRNLYRYSLTVFVSNILTVSPRSKTYSVSVQSTHTLSRSYTLTYSTRECASRTLLQPLTASSRSVAGNNIHLLVICDNSVIVNRFPCYHIFVNRQRVRLFKALQTVRHAQRP